MANRPPGGLLVRAPRIRPPSPVWTPAPSAARNVAEVVASTLPIVRSPATLRPPVLAAVALAAVGVGLWMLWGWLNSRSKGRNQPIGQEDIQLGPMAPISIAWQTVAWQEDLKSCSTGAVIGAQSAAPAALPAIQVAGSRVRWSVGTFVAGVVCSAGEATAGESYFIEVLDDAGQVVARRDAAFGGKESSNGISYSDPPRVVGAEIVSFSYNSQPQPIERPEREPTQPAPVVPISPGQIEVPTIAPAAVPLLPSPAQPTPEEVPGLVPQPQPARAPAPATPAIRPAAPPITQPGTRPRPSGVPGTAPAPGTAPPPGTAPGPGTTPAPGPGQFPSQDPSRPTQPIAPDGALVPSPAPPPPVTQTGTVAVGSKNNPIKIVPRQVPATLEGIALELGRIERKQEVMLGDDSGGQPDWMEKARAGGDAAMRLVELIFALNSGTTYTLSSPCEKDANGNPLPPVAVEVPSALNMMGALMNRMDALAELLQVHKNLKQPSCKNPRPQGDPVTVNFEEI